MNLSKVAFRNAGRSPLRGVLTVLAVAVSLIAVVALRAVKAGYTERVAQTPDNRVVSRHKIGWSQTIPVHYVDEVRKLAGVKQAMGARVAGLKHASMDKRWFSSMAVQAKPFVDMHYELVAPEEQKQAFVAQRNAALVSEELAEEYGWKLGDTIQLKGTIFPGSYPLSVAGIFRSTRHAFAQRSVWLHWEYLNEKVPLHERDRISLISAEIFQPSEGARIARAVDIHFDDREDQTLTQEDQAMHASLVGMFGALLHAIDSVSLMILGIVLLILGNTVALAVRERGQEYGVLRAIGFTPAQLAMFVILEGALLGFAGAGLGVALAYPVVQGPVSRYLAENMELPPLHVPGDVALSVVLAGTLLAALSAGIPAYRVARLPVVEALRRVG